MKALTKFILTTLLCASVTATQSCAFFSKSEFTEVTAAELSALADTFSDSQKRQIVGNKTIRDQIMNQFKTPFALAQAAEAEGLHKTEQFKQEFALTSDKLLATEYTKRNPDATVTKEDRAAYNNAHKAEFENDFALIVRGAKQAPSNEDKEAMHDQWAELKVRAERGRLAGIEKEPAIKVQLKFGKANSLANAYSKKLEEKFKLTPEEKKRYIAEHPEADVEKLQQKAQGFLDRVKKGEAFDKIASEVNDDDTKTNGGELPWFGKDGKMDVPGQIDEEFVKAAFALEKGQYTQQVIKTKLGFHIIKLEDKRMSDPAAAPKPSPVPAVANPAEPAASLTPQGPREEVRTRHIFVSTDAVDRFEQEEMDKKIKRAMEDASLKYPVKLPADFTVNVGGYDPNRIPGPGGGQGGQMKGINPNENK